MAETICAAKSDVQQPRLSVLTAGAHAPQLEVSLAALGLELRLRCPRVPGQEGIEVDPLASGRVDSEGAVSEPGELRGHDANLVKPRGSPPQ